MMDLRLVEECKGVPGYNLLNQVHDYLDEGLVHGDLSRSSHGKLFNAMFEMLVFEWRL